jgi:hypothetical protein
MPLGIVDGFQSIQVQEQYRELHVRVFHGAMSGPRQLPLQARYDLLARSPGYRPCHIDAHAFQSKGDLAQLLGSGGGDYACDLAQEIRVGHRLRPIAQSELKLIEWMNPTGISKPIGSLNSTKVVTTAMATTIRLRISFSF